MANRVTPVQLVEEIQGPRQEIQDGRAQPGPAVDRTLRDVLGWSPRARDPEAFVAALERSFSARPVRPPSAMPADGRALEPPAEIVDPSTEPVVWEHTPRGFALQVDLGALTGAQASLARRAQKTLADALPLLDGVTPLSPISDDEALAASREIVRSELQRIVDELAVEGGPSVGLVDQLFSDLVGFSPEAGASRLPAEEVGGQLGALRERFGLRRDLVNTVEEEQNFTNFLVLADYVTTLWSEWGDTRGAFLANAEDPFFGTQLVLIARELQVAGESVREVYDALDAVFIGAAERQTLSVTVDNTEVFLGALLEWVDRFVTTDARQLIETAGRDGALSLKPTLTVLADQVKAFSPGPSGSPLPGLFDNQLVAATLLSLEASLRKVSQLVEALEPPQTTIGIPLRPPAIDPSPPDVRLVGAPNCTPSGNLRVNLVGTNLSLIRIFAQQGPVRVPAQLSRPGPGQLQARFKLAQLRPGSWQIVAARDGVESPIGTFPVG